MYNNPLITIPRLQHNPNDAGYSHSHPHSEGATSGRFQGSDVTKKGGGRQAPDPNYQKPVLQQGVDKTSTFAPRGPMQPWEQDYEARKQEQFQLGGGHAVLGGEYGWGGSSGGLQDKFSWIPGINKKSADPRDPNLGMGEMFGGDKVGKLSPDLVSKVMDDAQPANVVTPEKVEQAVPTSEANASQVAADGGGSMNLAPAPDYTGQDPRGQFVGSEEDFQATEGTVAQREGKDISFGQAEGYGTKAAVVAPEAVTADVAETGEWWEQSGIFNEGQAETGERWSQEQYGEAYADFKGEFWEGGQTTGAYGLKHDRPGFGNNLEQGLGDFSTLGSLNTITKENLMSAVETFYKGKHGQYGTGVGDAANKMTLLQKKEMLYNEIKGMIDDDFDIDGFMKEIDPTMTDEELARFVETSTRVENEILGGKKHVPGKVSETLGDMQANIAKTLAKMGSGTETDAEVSSLIKSLSESVDIPEGYEVVRDSAGQPVIRFRGIEGKVEKDPETGLERQTYDMTQGRLTTAQEQQYNDALQYREQGQAAVQEHIQAKLGLSIDAQRAQIVSAEFTESLNLERDRFEFQQDQFDSNNALAEANVTGIFGDQPTLSAQDLMGRLTGRVQTGTRNEFDPEGGFTKVPIMADTVEMRRMKAELLGRFEGQPTINREQFDAAVKGYLADKSPTFAREQWENEQARLRDEALIAAGEVVKSRYMVRDEMTGRQREIVNTVDTLEKKRQVMEQKLQEAQLNGLRSIVVPILDAEGNPIPGQNETLQVSAIEQMRTDLDQQRLDHLMRMEEAAQTGMLDEDPTLAGRGMDVQEGQLGLQQQQLAAEQAALAGQAMQFDPTTGEMTGTVDALQSENVQNRMRAQALEDERAGLEQRGGPTDTPEGVQYAMQQENLRRTYVEGLNSGLAGATVEDTSSLENALNQALPPTPAGMVWDGQSGTFKLRAGYEGRAIDPATQREMEQIAPLLRARDRSERVLNKLQEHKFEFEQTKRMQDESDRRLREALGSADIETAEEEAYRKQVAERKLVEAQAKNEKYTMLFQLLQNPTALGMARRYGVLQQIEQDIGIQIPNVPEAGPANTIPTPQEWSSLNQEERAFRASLYASETGGSPENFFEMIGRNAPAQMQVTQHSVLMGTN